MRGFKGSTHGLLRQVARLLRENNGRDPADAYEEVRSIPAALD